MKQKHEAHMKLSSSRPDGTKHEAHLEHTFCTCILNTFASCLLHRVNGVLADVVQVNWQTVLWGIGLQFLFAIVVLRWPAGYAAFKWLGDRVSEFLAYTDAGSKFVFGDSYRDHLFAFQVSNRC